MLLSRSRTSGRVGAAVHEDAGAVDAAREQRRRRQGHRRDAGHGAQPVEHLPVERQRALLVVAIQLRVDAEEQQVLRVEADVHVAEVGERPQEQAGADQQDERDRDLHGEEDLARPAARADDAAARFLERRVHVHAGAAQRRQDAEDQPGQAADGEHEREHTPVEGARHVGGARQQLLAPVADDDAEGAAERRQQQAFRQELAYQPPARRAERQPHRQLLLPAWSRATAAGSRRWRRQSAGRARRRPPGARPSGTRSWRCRRTPRPPGSTRRRGTSVRDLLYERDRSSSESDSR